MRELQQFCAFVWDHPLVILLFLTAYYIGYCIRQDLGMRIRRWQDRRFAEDRTFIDPKTGVEMLK